MRYKAFGNTGLHVSAIGAGSWGMGGRGWGGVDRASSISALHAMVDYGVNLIDTAPGYGRGLAEEIVGEAVAGIRDKLIITTKCGMNIDKPGFAVKKANWDEIIRGVEGSLTRMRLDCVDVLLLHWPDENTPLRETMEAMDHLKRDGKVRFIGVSNLSIEQMEEARGYVDVAVTQLPYSMVDRSAEEQLRWAYTKKIANMTYGTLGAGILSGKIREYKDYGEEDMRGRFYPFFREPQFSKVMTLVKALDAIAAEHEAPVSQVALNWAVQKSFVDTALVGVRTVEHAKENCRAMEWELSNAEMSLIDSYINDLLG